MRYDVYFLFLQILIKTVIHSMVMVEKPEVERHGIIVIGNHAYKALDLSDEKSVKETIKFLLSLNYTNDERHKIPDAMEMMIDMFKRS